MMRNTRLRNNRLRKKRAIFPALLAAAALLALCLAPAGQALSTTDISVTSQHEAITWELIRMVEHDRELKALLTLSIRQAAQMNPDRQTNPVYDLPSYYAFIDRAARALPWQISPKGDYSTLYDRIDQSIGCFYFVCDQPLEALEDKGYYHNSLIYHEPFRTWLIHFTAEYGLYLNEEGSWCEEFYRNALANPDFHLDDGTYEDPKNWKSFNDFFARKLRDPSVRPVAAPEDEGVVVSPADSVPQGVFSIDDEGRVPAGVPVKTGTVTDIASLLGGSRWSEAFAGGTLTHTFLDVNDYHRYHFPVSGTVLEVSVIPQDDAPGGIITWSAEEGRYREYDSDAYGWQSIETRGVVILRMQTGALVAVVPVGMCQIASVNFEDAVVPGARVQKGDGLGYFLFGGSDIIMIFSRDAHFELSARPGDHILTGEEYGRVSSGDQR